MTAAALMRWSGLALILGGLCIALFVLLLLPVGGFFGAEHGRSPLWVPAHSFHLIGALFTLGGLVGLYTVQADRMGSLGFAGFLLAFVGTALFVATGALTALVWPVLVAAAPSLIDLSGALFGP